MRIVKQCCASRRIVEQSKSAPGAISRRLSSPVAKAMSPLASNCREEYR